MTDIIEPAARAEVSTEELIAQRDAASAAYYEGDPLMSDAEFDALHAALADRGVEETVGHGYAPSSRKVNHLRPMLSLDKTRSAAGVEEWAARTAIARIEATHKYDGLAVSIVYAADGSLARAVTRGSGTVGEDVTPAIRSMIANDHLPARVLTRATVEVRGEIVMTLPDFEAMNADLAARGAEKMANPRNAAAGILRREDVGDAGRYLSLVVYDLGDVIAEPGATQFFRAPAVSIEPAAASIEAAIADFGATRKTIGIETDGIVFAAESRADRDRLGASRTAPRWAIAYKYPNVYRTTVLRAIWWATGRTGKIVPSAEFETTFLAGGNLSNATLSSLARLQEMDVRIGDTILLTRSNEVIPYVDGRPLDPATGEPVPHAADSAPWTMPTECPSCGGGVHEAGRELWCDQGAGCAVTRSVVYSIQSLGVLGVSSALINALRDAGHPVNDIIDLLDITEEQIAELPRFGETSAAKAVAALAAVREGTLGDWIRAVGIPLISTTSYDLEEVFASLDALAEATYEDLTAMEGLGDAKASAVLAAAPKLRDWAERLRARGIVPEPGRPVEVVNDSSPLAGKVCVLTGTLPTLKRAEAAALIVQFGGSVGGSVGKTTDLLIAGPGSGAKSAKAAALGVEVMDGESFEAIVLGGAA